MHSSLLHILPWCVISGLCPFDIRFVAEGLDPVRLAMVCPPEKMSAGLSLFKKMWAIPSTILIQIAGNYISMQGMLFVCHETLMASTQSSLML